MVRKFSCYSDEDMYGCGHMSILGLAESEVIAECFIEEDLQKEFVFFSKYWKSFEEFRVKMRSDYHIDEYEVRVK